MRGCKKTFDAIYGNFSEGNTEVLAAWKSASHVPRKGGDGGDAEEKPPGGTRRSRRAGSARLFAAGQIFSLVPKLGTWECSSSGRNSVSRREAGRGREGRCRRTLTTKQSFPRWRAFPKPHFGNEGGSVTAAAVMNGGDD